MNIALLIARLLLTAVFLVAGLAKLADRAGSQKALRDFGVPGLLAAPGGVLLPLAELAVAVLLIPVATAWYGAIGALALLLIFVGGIGYNLARGRKPDCHCFGQIYSAPAGWPTLIRNFILAAIAGFVVAFGFSNPGLSAVDWFGALAVAQRLEVIVGIILLLLLIGTGWLLLEMMRQQGRLLLRIEALETQLGEGGKILQQPSNQAVPEAGLPVGTTAPAFALAGLYGETITLDSLRAADKPVVLLFSDPGCGPCNALMPEIGRWQRDYAGKLLLAVISRGTPEANRNKSSEHGITHLLIQKDREVAEAYKVNGTPGAVLVHPDGTIGSAAAMGADAIRVLVAQAVGLPALNNVPAAALMNGSALPVVVPANGNTAVPARPKIGDAAPSFALSNLSGKMVNLSDFRGKPTLLLFWNPGCGFCQRMLDDLKAWETNAPKGAPRMLVISTGDAETNRSMGLRSTILLDNQNMSVGSKFGATGTPMGVLIDAQGRVASEVAVGAPAVLELANKDAATA